MHTTYHRQTDGKPVSEQDAFDERGVLRAGFSMRTPVMLRDGVPVDHAPLRTSTATTDAYDASLRDAWKNVPLTVSDAAVRDAKLAGTLAGIKDRREAAYQKYDADLQNAWR